MSQSFCKSVNSILLRKKKSNREKKNVNKHSTIGSLDITYSGVSDQAVQ